MLQSDLEDRLLDLQECQNNEETLRVAELINSIKLSIDAITPKLRAAREVLDRLSAQEKQEVAAGVTAGQALADLGNPGIYNPARAYFFGVGESVLLEFLLSVRRTSGEHFVATPLEIRRATGISSYEIPILMKHLAETGAIGYTCSSFTRQASQDIRFKIKDFVETLLMRATALFKQEGRPL